jgi:hypothetical protein
VGYEEVTADVATGLVVLQEIVTLQLLLPEAIVQEEGTVRVPDMEVAALTTTLAVDCVSPVPAFEHFMVYV